MVHRAHLRFRKSLVSSAHSQSQYGGGHRSVSPSVTAVTSSQIKLLNAGHGRSEETYCFVSDFPASSQQQSM